MLAYFFFNTNSQSYRNYRGNSCADQFGTYHRCVLMQAGQPVISLQLIWSERPLQYLRRGNEKILYQRTFLFYHLFGKKLLKLLFLHFSFFSYISKPNL